MKVAYISSKFDELCPQTAEITWNIFWPTLLKVSIFS